MYQKGDYLVYRKDVCVVKDILEMRGEAYYALSPLSDDSLSLKVPASNEFLRNVLTKDEAENLIEHMSEIETLDLNEKMLEHEYQALLASSSLEDLIKIIKTTYLRNLKRVDEGKKIGEKDDFYFKKAEKLLYTELSISLNLSYDETKEYIVNKLSTK